MKIFVLFPILGLLIADTAIAEEACKAPAACAETRTCGSAAQCGRCGTHCGCEKYCRVVCEMKEVKKTVWVVKCSEFCTLMPNCGHDGCCDCESCRARASSGSDRSCGGECGKKCDPCAAENNKTFVPPKCGKVREKKTLEKKEIVCKVPSYKCVVVYCCPQCGEGEKATPSTPPPAKPAVPAPAPSKTTLEAPLPPVMATSFEK
jgi:hypothetical protein